ncbi:MAG: aminotransferase class V-fold PLP-dependent enzyme, partial [Tissierellia bacterium]|nr:aminotransferase class V-fold PLP-dependent enzyme [Tissierellia bacterium]
EKGIYFHTDAVQAMGNVRIDVKKEDIDLLTMSAHKFNGPKGVGALYIKRGVKIESLIHGGGQERKKRAGTENVPGIVGMGKALELQYENFDEHQEKLTKMRDYLIDNILEKIPYSRLNGDRINRLPGNVNISFEFVEGESILMLLDMEGIEAASGSACNSASLEPSHVLLAIGLPHEVAHGSVRLSLGYYNKEEDLPFVVDKLQEIIEKLREMSPLYKK